MYFAIFFNKSSKSAIGIPGILIFLKNMAKSAGEKKKKNLHFHNFFKAVKVLMADSH